MSIRSDIRALWRSPSRWCRAALLVAGASLVVHALSLAGVGWRALSPVAIALHLAVMILLGGAMGRRPKGWWRQRVRLAGTPSPALSRPLVGLCVVLAVYALLWFFCLFAAYGEGAPEQRDGGWYWVQHGEAVRAMSADAARWFDARMLSVFSAVWLAFALPSALAHDRRRRRADAERAERADAAAA